jgi:hypothetical protein
VARRLGGLDGRNGDLRDTEGRHQVVQGDGLVRVEGGPVVTGGPSEDLQTHRAGPTAAASFAALLGPGAGEL